MDGDRKLAFVAPSEDAGINVLTIGSGEDIGRS
jgi:hypothetical protein